MRDLEWGITKFLLFSQSDYDPSFSSLRIDQYDFDFEKDEEWEEEKSYTLVEETAKDCEENIKEDELK